jgi:Rps23 Pro-64 3,4-dihydroxylase Tpa1-like proline 4-hydroxylase
MFNKDYFSELILSKLELQKKNLLNQWSNPEKTQTKHFIVDNLLSEEDCLKIYKSFENKKIIWKVRKSFRESKNTTAQVDNFDSIIPAISDAFQEEKVVDCISKITEIDEIEGDSSLYGSGISSMKKGDFLNPHIDNSHDSKRQSFRRLNLLYYVSPNWSEEKGGNFELWDKKIKNPKTIISKFNRLIVMETGPNTYHSVNPVLVDETRYCVSSYYFSNKSFNGKKYYHVTSFTGRPNQKILRVYGLVDNFIRYVASNYLNLKRFDHKKILRK